MDVHQYRPLVFQGGDVVLHTSKNPSGIFVLHKDILMARSPYFCGMLSEEWGKRPEARSTGSLPVFEMDLRLDCEHGYALPVLRVSDPVLIRVSNSPFQNQHFESSHLCDGPSTSNPSNETVFWYDILQGTTSTQPNGQSVSQVAPQVSHQRSKLYNSLHKPIEHHVNDLTRILKLENIRSSDWWGQREPHRLNHSNTLGYVRAIWKCLIRLMYGEGQVLIPSKKISCPKQVVFIANLYAYAELLGFDDDILGRIRNGLEDIRGIWTTVSQAPDIFIDLAYYMDMPDMYMDAMKHWISRHPKTDQLRKWLSPGSEDKLRLMTAGILDHNLAVAKLSREVIDQTVRTMPSYLPNPYEISMIEAMPPWAFFPGAFKGSSTVTTEYRAVVNDILVKDLILLMASINATGEYTDATGEYIDPIRWGMPAGQQPKWTYLSPVEALRGIAELAGDPFSDKGSKAIAKFFNLKEIVEKDSHLSLEQLTGVFGMRLTEYDGVFERLYGLSPNVEHRCHEGRWRGSTCLACAYPKHSLPNFLYMIDVYSLCDDEDEPRPWPLNLDTTEDEGEQELDVPLMEPASFRYLQAIGLGPQFAHLEDSDQKGSNSRADGDLASGVDDYNLDFLFGSCQETLPVWGSGT
jgi:hypothetical protein